MFRGVRFVFALATLVFLSVSVTTMKGQAAPSDERQQVIDAINAFFTDLQAGTPADLHALLTPDFYLFERGERLNADSMLTMMKAAQASGKRYEWHVTEPDVHIGGAVAWIAYVNRGSITNKSGRHDVTWLESGGLVKRDGRWLIAFLHSTRVAMAGESRASN